MNKYGMKESFRDPRPHRTARLAGIFYLLTFLIGGIAEFASSGLVAPGDARATAANVLAHESSFWSGFVAFLLVLACYIAVTGLFYELFKPVNPTLSLLAAFFSLVGSAVQASACFFYLGPLLLLRNADNAGGVSVNELQDLAFLSLNSYGQAYCIGFVFFGFYCCLIGYLTFKSAFLPRILGVLMMAAGLGWLTFLLPPLANGLWPYVAVPGVVGETSLTLWLLAKGVDAQRWRDLADG